MFNILTLVKEIDNIKFLNNKIVKRSVTFLSIDQHPISLFFLYFFWYFFRKVLQLGNSVYTIGHSVLTSLKLNEKYVIFCFYFANVRALRCTRGQHLLITSKSSSITYFQLLNYLFCLEGYLWDGIGNRLFT